MAKSVGEFLSWRYESIGNNTNDSILICITASYDVPLVKNFFRQNFNT